MPHPNIELARNFVHLMTAVHGPDYKAELAQHRVPNSGSFQWLIRMLRISAEGGNGG